MVWPTSGVNGGFLRTAAFDYGPGPNMGQSSSPAADGTPARTYARARAFDVFLAKGAYQQYVPAQVKDASQGNPVAVLLGYVNAAEADATQPPTPPGSGGFDPALYVVGSSGGRSYFLSVVAQGFGNWTMRPDSAAWQANRADAAHTLIASYQYDGVVFDIWGGSPFTANRDDAYSTVDLSLLSPQPADTTPASGGYSWTSWTDGLHAIAAAARTAMGSGRPVGANCFGSGQSYANPGTTDVRVHWGFAEYLMAEVWLRDARTDTITTFPSETNFVAALNMLVDAAMRPPGVVVATTKTWVTGTQAQVDAWHRYALAAFLLASDGRQLFCFSQGDRSSIGQCDYQPPSPYWPQASKIGTPTDVQAALAAGTAPWTVLTSGTARLYVRTFSNGIVIVNPTGAAGTYTLPAGVWTDLDGVEHSAGSLAVPATSGTVLVNTTNVATPPTALAYPYSRISTYDSFAVSDVKPINLGTQTGRALPFAELAKHYAHVHHESGGTWVTGNDGRGTSVTTLASKLATLGCHSSSYTNGSYVMQGLGTPFSREGQWVEQNHPELISTWIAGMSITGAGGDSLSSAVVAGDTSIVVDYHSTPTFAYFASSAAGNFSTTVHDVVSFIKLGSEWQSAAQPTGGKVEYVKVTGVQKDLPSAGKVTLTVQRGAFGTVGKSWVAGTRVQVPVYNGKGDRGPLWGVPDTTSAGDPNHVATDFPLRYALKIWRPEFAAFLAHRLRVYDGQSDGTVHSGDQALSGFDTFWLDVSTNMFNQIAWTPDNSTPDVTDRNGGRDPGWVYDDRVDGVETQSQYHSDQLTKIANVRALTGANADIAGTRMHTNNASSGSASATDEVNQLFWTPPAKGGTSYDSGSFENWLNAVTLAKWQNAMTQLVAVFRDDVPGTPWVRPEGMTLPQRNAYYRFTYGTWLLAWRPTSTYPDYMAKANAASVNTWGIYPADDLYYYDFGNPLDSPTAAAANYQRADGLYRRVYSKGEVIVNPTAAAVTYTYPAKGWELTPTVNGNGVAPTRVGPGTATTTISIPSQDSAFVIYDVAAAGIAFRTSFQSAAANASATSIATTIPSAVQAGDLMLAAVGQAGGDQPVTAPAGWTQLGLDTPLHNASGVVGGAITWFYKFAVAADASSTVTWTIPTRDRWAVLASVFSGADLALEQTVDEAVRGTSHTTPAISTSGRSDEWLVSFFFARTGNSFAFTADSADTTRQTVASTVGTPYLAAVLADSNGAVANGTPTRTGTTNTTPIVTGMGAVTLQPAGGVSSDTLSASDAVTTADVPSRGPVGHPRAASEQVSVIDVATSDRPHSHGRAVLDTAGAASDSVAAQILRNTRLLTELAYAPRNLAPGGGVFVPATLDAWASGSAAGGTGPTLTADDTVTVPGSHGVAVAWRASAAQAYASVLVDGFVVGQDYTASVYVQGAAGGSVVRMQLQASPVVTGTAYTPDGTLQRISVTFTATATSHRIRVSSTSPIASSTTYMTAWQVEPGDVVTPWANTDPQGQQVPDQAVLSQQSTTRLPSESLTTGDAVTRTRLAAVGASDSTTVSASVGRATSVGVSLSESYTSADAVAASGVTHKAVLTESLTASSDAAAWRGAWQSRLIDTLTGPSDQPARTWSVGRGTSDATSVTESPARQGAVTAVNVAEAVTGRESVQLVQALRRGASETLAVSESPLRATGRLRGSAETLTASDVARVAFSSGRNPVETLSTSDAATRSADVVVRTVSELLASSDSMTWHAGRGYGLAETVQGVDVVSYAARVTRLFAETVGGVDSVRSPVSRPRRADDGSATTDSAMIAPTFFRATTETLVNGDFALVGGGLLRLTAEFLGAPPDAVQRFVSRPRTAADGAPAPSDASTSHVAPSRAVAEATPTFDGYTAVLVLPRRVADGGPASDAAVWRRTAFRSVGESAPFGGDVMAAGQSVRLRAISETVPLPLAFVDRRLALTGSRGETMSTIDVASTRSVTAGGSSDAVPLADDVPTLSLAYAARVFDGQATLAFAFRLFAVRRAVAERTATGDAPSARTGYVGRSGGTLQVVAIDVGIRVPEGG